VVNASGTIFDQVGLSVGSAFTEGSPLPPLTSELNRGYERRPGGASGPTQDTDNNQTDLRFTSPSQPQNASSACLQLLIHFAFACGHGRNQSTRFHVSTALRY
jgi:uncharacterized protein